MVWYADTFWCDGCGLEIYWEPIAKGQLIFCCRKCLIGEKCDCEDYQEEYPSNLTSQDSNYSHSEV